MTPEIFWIEDVHLQGVNMFLTDSHIGQNIRAGQCRTFESPVREWIERILEPGWDYVDVGAHIGVFACYALKLIDGDGTVVCFEPRKDLSGILLGNLALQDSMTKYHVVPAAVWDSERKITLYENHAQSDGDNRVTNVTGLAGAEGWRAVEVHTVTLNKVAPTYLGRFNRPVFLKIDTQWAEMECLRGAKGPFLDRVEAGVCEVQTETRNDVVNFLVENGFKYTDLGPDVGFHREGC